MTLIYVPKCGKSIRPSTHLENRQKCVVFPETISLPWTDCMFESEDKLIQGFVAGNPEAVAQVQTWIRIVARSMIWNKDITDEDVVSDTIYKLLVNFRSNKFKHASSLKSYVQSVARHTTIDELRNRKRARECAMRAAQEEDDVVEMATDVEDEEHQMYLVNRILSKIDESCIKLWKMIHLEGHNYKKISEILGVTEGAIKARVSRCKDKALEARREIE